MRWMCSAPTMPPGSIRVSNWTVSPWVSAACLRNRMRSRLTGLAIQGPSTLARTGASARSCGPPLVNRDPLPAPPRKGVGRRQPQGGGRGHRDSLPDPPRKGRDTVAARREKWVPQGRWRYIADMNRLTGVLAVAALLAAGCAPAAGTTTTQARTGAHVSLHLVPPDAQGAAARPVLRSAPALPNQAPVISTQRPIHGTPQPPPTPAPP